jgi:hypothetical protein
MITIQQREDKFVKCKLTALKICNNAKPDIDSISNIIAIKTDTEYIIPELSAECLSWKQQHHPRKQNLKTRHKHNLQTLTSLNLRMV